MTPLQNKFCSPSDVDGIVTATEVVRENGGKLRKGKLIVMPADANPVP